MAYVLFLAYFSAALKVNNPGWVEPNPRLNMSATDSLKFIHSFHFIQSK